MATSQGYAALLEPTVYLSRGSKYMSRSGPTTEVTWVSESRVEYGSGAATATKDDAPREDLETLSDIQELDTRGLFLRMKRYDRFGNLARHGFLVALQRVYENKLYLELGFSSPRHLLQSEFRMTRSNAAVFLQVA